MKPVQDEHFLTAPGQRGNASFQVVDDLATRDGVGHIGRLRIRHRAVGQPGIGMRVACALGPVAVDGAMRGDVPQESQRLHDVTRRRTLQQLHTHVLQHVAREMTIAKAAAYMIDELVVVTQERREERRMGGVAQHGQGEIRRGRQGRSEEAERKSD